MVLILGGAFYINKTITHYQDVKFEEERIARVEDVSQSTTEHEIEIQELSQMSRDDIAQFIEENAYVETEEEKEANVYDGFYDDPWADTENFNYMTPDSTPEEVPEEVKEGDENTSSSEENAEEHEKYTLEERQEFRTSSEETALWIESDEEILKNSKEDFSGIKIACLGDSITEAINLEDLDNFKQYSYPTKLGEILNAESVTNLGIGGSSYGRYWYEPFCERYDQIPEDTDLIIIMGGTNDGYCLTEDLIGSMEDRSPRTLYGDVNDLMKGLKENYPNAEVIFMTPMPNLLHDVLRNEREYLMSQTIEVNCVLELAAEYGFDVIDLYNSNFFDSHDADICADYIPDSVHPNIEGYEIFAQHVAAEIIRLHEGKSTDDEFSDESEKDLKEELKEELKEDLELEEILNEEVIEDNDDVLVDDKDKTFSVFRSDKVENKEDKNVNDDKEADDSTKESKIEIYARDEE